MPDTVPSPPKKVAFIGIRTTDDVKRAAMEAARLERRSVSQWVEGVLLAALKKKDKK